MAENMTFLPRDRILSFAEIEQLSDILIRRGVRKIRLTGGEPLVRRGILRSRSRARRATRPGARRAYPDHERDPARGGASALFERRHPADQCRAWTASMRRVSL